MNYQNGSYQNYSFNQPNYQNYQNPQEQNFQNNNYFYQINNSNQNMNSNYYNNNNNNNNINQQNKNDNPNQDSQYLISRKLKDIPMEEFTDFISSLNITGLKELKQKIENFSDNDKII